jgi:hypothetical protein
MLACLSSNLKAASMTLSSSVLSFPLVSLNLVTYSLSSFASFSEGVIFSSFTVNTSFGGVLGRSGTLGAAGVGTKFWTF